MTFTPPLPVDSASTEDPSLIRTVDERPRSASKANKSAVTRISLIGMVQRGDSHDG